MTNHVKDVIFDLNFEGWFRVAQSFLQNRQNTFLRHLSAFGGFDIRYSLFKFSLFDRTSRFSGQRLGCLRCVA